MIKPRHTPVTDRAVFGSQRPPHDTRGAELFKIQRLRLRQLQDCLQLLIPHVVGTHVKVVGNVYKYITYNSLVIIFSNTTQTEALIYVLLTSNYHYY